MSKNKIRNIEKFRRCSVCGESLMYVRSPIFDGVEWLCPDCYYLIHPNIVLMIRQYKSL